MATNDSIKSLWKVWLRPNLLTETPNDFVAEVSTVKDTLKNEQIARLIVNEGSEIKYDTLLSILRQRDRVVRQALCDGSSVMDDNCQLTPRVLGTWIGSTAKFDPAVHRRTVDVVPTAVLRETLVGVGVEVLGMKPETSGIGLVTDTVSGLTNGSITKGDDIDVEGKVINVSGDAPEVGVYFVNDETGERTKVSRRLTQNTPSRLIARVPDSLTDGIYHLEVVTQAARGGKLLKAPRTVVYEQPLYVGVTPPTGDTETGGEDGEDTEEGGGGGMG